MKLSFSIILLLLLKLTALYGQSLSYFDSGNTSLVVRLQGAVSAAVKIEHAGIRAPLVNNKPVYFQVIDDNTLHLSFFTFGPTHVYFKIGSDSFHTILFPNRSDSLYLAFDREIVVDRKYVGVFKEFFQESDAWFDAVKSSLEYSNQYAADHFFEKKKLDGVFADANSFRDSRLKRSEYLKAKYQPSSLSIKRMFDNYIDFFYLGLLTRQYEVGMVSYNRNIGLDSSDVFKHIPNRDLSFYDKIVEAKLADTMMLDTYNYYSFLNEIIHDPLLALPEIDQVPPNIYQAKLVELFGNRFESADNLFFDMLIATAYINQINAGKVLSTQQKHELKLFWADNPLNDFVLSENQSMNKKLVKLSSQNYLNFSKEEFNVLPKILAEHLGKVVVVDFWATWCAPCLNAFDQTKEIKKEYDNHEDVVFLYITEESSNFNQWQNYVEQIGGIHYYLFNEQFDSIQIHYGFKSIPSYLVFDKEGKLSEQKLGFTGDFNDLKIWIEKAYRQSD